MSTDNPENPETLGLKQKNLHSGVWRIEGYLVVRYGYRSWGRSSIIWAIYPGETTGYGARPSHRALHGTRTLRDARNWIRDHPITSPGSSR